MHRLLLPFVLLCLAGCGQKDASTGKGSAAPAYVPSAAKSHEAAIEGQQGGDSDAANDDVDFSASETSPPNANDGSPAPDEDIADDRSQAGEAATADDDAKPPDSDAGLPAGAEEPAAEPSDADAAAQASRESKGSGSKLFRGLANSISRAVVKTFSEPPAVPPAPLEDDPFPNGEPADADPDVNR